MACFYYTFKNWIDPKGSLEDVLVVFHRHDHGTVIVTTMLNNHERRAQHPRVLPKKKKKNTYPSTLEENSKGKLLGLLFGIVIVKAKII